MISDDVKLISLTKGMFTLIDKEDFDRVNEHYWHANVKANTCYATGGPDGRTLLHRFLLNINDSSILIDHKNGFGLDNRKSNLRIANHMQNNQNRRINQNNTTGYKGVSFEMPRNMFAARISHKGKQKFLGYFKTPQEAASAYEKAAKELHKEFYCAENIKIFDAKSAENKIQMIELEQTRKLRIIAAGIQNATKECRLIVQTAKEALDKLMSNIEYNISEE